MKNQGQIHYVLAPFLSCQAAYGEDEEMFFKLRYVRDYIAATGIQTVFSWVVKIAITVILGFLVTIALGKTTIMQDDSMSPTLLAGDVVLTNRFSYQLGEPARGDLIAFKLSDDEMASTRIKRVIGLPGETIQIIDGNIYIDGEKYVESMKFPTIENPGLAEEAIKLGNGEYFVLGDNRNSSEDSRFAAVGVIDKKEIVGKIWFCFSPKERMGLID